MKKIKSFTINHDTHDVGFYQSSDFESIFTFDLRFKKPNSADFLSPSVCHTIEHLFATAARNGILKDSVVYFGPMGCRTGFYFLLKDVDLASAQEYTAQCISECLKMTEIPGNKKIECGNYRAHNLKVAKTELAKYLSVIKR